MFISKRVFLHELRAFTTVQIHSWKLNKNEGIWRNVICLVAIQWNSFSTEHDMLKSRGGDDLKVKLEVELKSLPSQIGVRNEMKLFVLGEKDRNLNCEQSFNYLLYCVCTESK